MAPRIPLLVLLLLLASPARAEFPLTDERPLAPTLGFSETPAVVATDAGFVAFWKTRTTYGADGLVQVGRFSRDGELEARTTLWELPVFSLSDAASSGDQILLAGRCSDAFCAVRLSAAGAFLGTTTFPGTHPAAVRVATDGDSFLILTQLWGGGSAGIVAYPVSREGVAGTPLRIAPWDGTSQTVSATAVDGTWFAAFGAAGTYALARLSDTGVAASVPLDAPFAIQDAAIAASGSRILVVATAKTPLEGPRMRTAVFDADLVRRSDWAPLDETAFAAHLAPTSSGWIVAASRLLPSGASDAAVRAVGHEGYIGDPTTISSLDGRFVDIAASDDRAALVWPTLARSPIPGYPSNDVRLATFDAAAAPVRAPSTISLGPAPQVDPAAAHGGGVTLAAWSERTPGGAFVVKARPFDASGTPRAPAVTMPSSGVSQFRPQVAWGDSSFLVIWAEASADWTTSTLGARVSADGELLDLEKIVVAETGAYASVDWSGSAWIVVSTAERLEARRVSSSGALVDAVPTVIATPTSEWGIGASAIDCGDAGCLVAWESHPSWMCRFDPCIPPEPAIVASRIAPDLAVLDPAPLQVTAPYEDVSALTVSWNETAGAWLVAWSLAGRQRISSAGVLLDPPTRTPIHARDLGFVSAIPEREGWRLAWTPESIPVRYGSTLGADAFHGWSATGAVIDVAERRAIATTPEREWNPLLVAAPTPLAFFLRESQISAGAPSILGRVLDETEVVPTNITATWTRVDPGKVRLAWTSDVPGVARFTIVRFDGRYDFAFQTMWLGPAARSAEFDHPEGRAGRFLVRADTTSGPVDSNVVVIPGNRTRFVERE